MMGEAKTQSAVLDPKYFRPIKLSSWFFSKLDKQARILQDKGFLVYKPYHVDWLLRYSIWFLPAIDCKDACP